MTCYTTRTYEEQRAIQRLWEAGVQAKEIADELEAPYPPSTQNCGMARTGTGCRTSARATIADLAQL